jgi:hypothetical protein
VLETRAKGMRRVDSPRRTLSHLLVRCPFFLPKRYGLSHRRPEASLHTTQPGRLNCWPAGVPTLAAGAYAC